MQDPKITFLLHLLAAICERPQQMVYRVDGQTITLRVWRRDQPRLVGQSGRNIQAIRAMVREMTGLHVTLLEPEESFTGTAYTGNVPSFQTLVRELAELSDPCATVVEDNEGENWELDVVGGDFGQLTKCGVNQLVHAIGKAHKAKVEVLFDGV